MITQDEQIRQALSKHWQASAAGDANAEHDIHDDDAICDYPQSGERILPACCAGVLRPAGIAVGVLWAVGERERRHDVQLHAQSPRDRVRWQVGATGIHFFMPAGAEAFKRDNPDTEVRYFETGTLHWRPTISKSSVPFETSSIAN